MTIYHFKISSSYTEDYFPFGYFDELKFNLAFHNIQRLTTCNIIHARKRVAQEVNYI